VYIIHKDFIPLLYFDSVGLGYKEGYLAVTKGFIWEMFWREI